DPNPDAALLSPVMTTVKRALDYPESLHFSDCTVDPSFVPYGIGEGLLAPKDLIRTLGLRGLTSDKLTSTRVIPPLSLSTQPPPDLGEELSEHIVMAPMEAERATVTFHVQPGDAVAEDQVIAEIEADKGTVEILAPVAGVLKEFRVPELEELEILTTTELFQILPQSNAQSETVPPFKTKETRQTRPNPITLESGASVTPLSRMQLAMADNMTVKPGDTKSFGVSETVDFQPLMALSKQSKLSPVTYLIKQLGESAQALGLNKKLTTEKTGMSSGFSSVDIGLAMEVDGQLRVAVVRDVLNKSEAEIKADIVAMVKQGPKLSPQDQNLDNVCYILTSLGKDAPKIVNPTLPKGMTGILGIGGMRKDQSEFSFSLCHATLNGSEGAKLMTDVSARISSMGEAETPAPSKYKPMIRFRYAQQKKNPGQ
ncbi:MAG: pyruvate/2-oxoglutarate dehydrogenase complex dihydrolipoamide acyltransferase (E2) component, partial [Candidatus Marinamargulisbacteria bacterium]